jgi:hypothetical protein
MKRLCELGLLGLLAVALFAQVPRGGSIAPPGFGNVVFPGQPGPYVHAPTSFPMRLGATVAGAPLGGRGGSLVVPYSYPVYVGGYGYGYGYGYDPSAQAPQEAPSQTTVVYAYPPQQQQQQAPQVIINQNFLGTQPQTGADSDSGTTLYQAPSRPPAEPAAAGSSGSKGPIFLIAYKDHSVYSAVAYWVEAGTLHYITTDGKHNQASLDLIDRNMSEEINKEQDVDFILPGKAATAAPAAAPAN